MKADEDARASALEQRPRDWKQGALGTESLLESRPKKNLHAAAAGEVELDVYLLLVHRQAQATRCLAEIPNPNSKHITETLNRERLNRTKQTKTNLTTPEAILSRNFPCPDH